MDRVSSAILQLVSTETCRLLLHWKQTRWATLNVNGLLTTHKCRFLEIDLLRYNMATLCVQETHVRGAVRVNCGKKQALLYSGSDNSSHHGVGIILKNELLPRLQWYRCISSCVIFVLLRQPCRYGSHTDILVMSCFAPMNVGSIRDKSVRVDFYDTLEDTVPQIAFLP